MAGKTFDFSVLFKAIDKISEPMKKIGRSFKNLSALLKKASKGFKDLSDKIQRVGKKMKDVGKSMSLKLTAPLALIGGLALKSAIDFESAFTGVRKTVEATEPQFQKLRKELMALALEVPIATEEIFGIAEAAGQLGIKQKDLMRFTKVMADLGATTNMSAEEAATSLARFANVVGVSSDDFDRLGSSIVDLGNNMAANEREIVEMGGRLAKAGVFAGLSADQIMGFAAALTSVGINAEAGGTAFSQVMMRIGKEIGTGSEKLQLFADVTGKSVGEFEKLWKENAAEAMLQFTEGLKRAEGEGVNLNIVLDQLGLDGIRVASSLLASAAAGDKFRGALERSSKAWKENNALTKEAKLRYATAASQLKMAKNRAVQLAVSFGSVFVPALLAVTKFFEPIVKWLTELSPVSKKIIGTVLIVVGVLGPLIVALGIVVTAFTAITTAVAAVSAPVLAVIGGITAAVVALGAALAYAYSFWEKLKSDGGQDYSKITPEEEFFGKGGMPEFVGSSKSETDINIKVQAAEGSLATVEKVENKKGDAAVSVASLGYLGAH